MKWWNDEMMELHLLTTSGLVRSKMAFFGPFCSQKWVFFLFVAISLVKSYRNGKKRKKWVIFLWHIALVKFLDFGSKMAFFFCFKDMRHHLCNELWTILGVSGTPHMRDTLIWGIASPHMRSLFFEKLSLWNFFCSQNSSLIST